MLWIGSNHLPPDGFKEAPTTALVRKNLRQFYAPFHPMSFLYACPGISPQRRRACSFEFIAQSYPHRTAIQLSKNKYPLTHYQWERLFFRVFWKNIFYPFTCSHRERQFVHPFSKNISSYIGLLKNPSEINPPEWKIFLSPHLYSHFRGQNLSPAFKNFRTYIPQLFHLDIKPDFENIFSLHLLCKSGVIFLGCLQKLFLRNKKVLSESCGKDCYHKSCDWRKTKNTAWEIKQIALSYPSYGAWVVIFTDAPPTRYEVLFSFRNHYKYYFWPCQWVKTLLSLLTDNRTVTPSDAIILSSVFHICNSKWPTFFVHALRCRKSSTTHAEKANRTRNKIWIILFGSNSRNIIQKQNGKNRTLRLYTIIILRHTFLQKAYNIYIA